MPGETLEKGPGSRRTVRVVLNAVSAKSGGAATFIRNLSWSLASDDPGKQYCLFLPPAQIGAVSPPSENIAVVATDIGYKAFWQRFFWDQITLRRLVRQQKADVLISTSDFGMLFPPCRQVLLVRNPLFFSDLYLRYILPAKSWRFRIEFLLRRWLVARSIKHSDVVMTASKSMMDDVRRFIQVPDEKAVVSPFGVPLGTFSASTRSQDRNPIKLLYISEYSDYKNLTTLLRALLVLRRRGADGFRLISSADPSQFPEVEISSRQADRALANHPSLARFVEFSGRIPYEEVKRFYQESDIFVFPSMAESFGHPLVEAMASGLPILASDIPICREICGEAALYFRPLDPEDLAEKILRMKESATLRDRLGKLGRERAETLFDWKRYVRRFVDTIERVASEEMKVSAT